MANLTIHMGMVPTVVAGAATAAATGAALAATATGELVGYYIAPSPAGNDTTGNGSFGSPWRTPSPFLSLPPNPGDTLYCRDGSYTATDLLFVDDLQGTSGSPITIAAYPGETPVFTGDASGGAFQFRQGSAYLVLDGLQYTGFSPTASGIIWIGDTSTLTGPITIRNCKFTAKSGLTQNEHAIYASNRATGVTVEDCVFIGAYPTDDPSGAAVEVYHTPGAIGTTVQRCIFDGWTQAVQVYDADSTATILHNTFVNNDWNIDLTYHSTVLVRDNAGDDADGGVAFNIWDPNDPGLTADHNFWGQSFDANYLLLAGETGRGAASDGSDAGALDW